MSSFGEMFPADLRKKLAADNLKQGAIIRVPVNDTNPPKTKYLVIINADAENVCFATIFLNSDINVNVLNTVELQNLQVWIKSADCSFMERDSYADCSKLSERSFREVTSYIETYPQAHRGQLPDDYLSQIINKITAAPTITNAQKKKFGLK